MKKLKLNRYFVLIVFVFAAHCICAQNASEDLIGVWVCDSLEDDDTEFSMVNNLRITFLKDSLATVSLATIPEGFDSSELSTLLSAKWNLIEGDVNKVNFCMEHDQEYGRGVDCEELIFEFVRPNYLLLTDGKEPIYFRRE